MAQILVRNLEAEVIEALKSRARSNHRSLEAELRLILQEAANAAPMGAAALAAQVRLRLGGRDHSDSATLLAEDRAR